MSKANNVEEFMAAVVDESRNEKTAEMIEGEADYNRDCVEMIVRVYTTNSEGHVVARNIHLGVGSQETAEDAAASYHTLFHYLPEMKVKCFIEAEPQYLC